MAQVIDGLKAESETLTPETRSYHQECCLLLIEQYGNDIGVIFAFLMNIVKLQRGQWFLIEAGVPHCYV